MKTKLIGAFLMTVIAASAAHAALSDGEIAQTVITSNNLDIDAAKMAKSRSQNKEIQSFAQMMIDDHTNANKEVSDLANKLNIRPKSDTDIAAMSTKAKANEMKLKNKTGKDFDKTYIDNQVAFHQSVLDDIDKKLMPDAQNAELKALLAKVRPTVQMHLDHAKTIQSSMQ